MGVYNLLITAVWALCFVTNVFIDSCAICFGDYLDCYAAFAVPCSNSLNRRFRSPQTSCFDVRRASSRFEEVGIAISSSLVRYVWDIA